MPLRIGHRGAAGHERENTTRSFLRALDLGAKHIGHHLEDRRVRRRAAGRQDGLDRDTHPA